MTGARFCNTTGLRALVLAHKQAAAHHTELRLVITSANVLRVLAITKLDTVLRIFPSLDAAQAAALPGRRIVPGQRGNPGFLPEARSRPSSHRSPHWRSLAASRHCRVICTCQLDADRGKGRRDPGTCGPRWPVRPAARQAGCGGLGVSLYRRMLPGK